MGRGPMSREENPIVAIANYETVFVAEPEISAEQADQFVNKIKEVITAHQGAVLSEDRWGRRRLAYAIRGHREGFYGVLTFSAQPTVVAALDHLYRVTDSVLRFLVVRQIQKVSKWKPRRERPPEGHRPGRPGHPLGAGAAPTLAPGEQSGRPGPVSRPVASATPVPPPTVTTAASPQATAATPQATAAAPAETLSNEGGQPHE